MFRKNEKHLQKNLFGFQSSLPLGQQKLLYESEEYKFYEIIFCNIKEEDFKCLYSEKESRPNSPVNSMVSSLILKERKDWSYAELFNQIGFNLLTKTALGLDHIDEIPFVASTLFYFQNKLDIPLLDDNYNDNNNKYNSKYNCNCNCMKYLKLIINKCYNIYTLNFVKN